MTIEKKTPPRTKRRAYKRLDIDAIAAALTAAPGEWHLIDTDRAQRLNVRVRGWHSRGGGLNPGPFELRVVTTKLSKKGRDYNKGELYARYNPIVPDGGSDWRKMARTYPAD